MKNDKKIKASIKYGKTVLYIRLDNKLLDLISVLKDFYGYCNRNDLFPFLLVSSILDIAAYKPQNDWPSEKTKAFKKAKKYASSFEQALCLSAAKSVLAKQPKNTKMTVHQLAVKTKKGIKNANKS